MSNLSNFNRFKQNPPLGQPTCSACFGQVRSMSSKCDCPKDTVVLRYCCGMYSPLYAMLLFLFPELCKCFSGSHDYGNCMSRSSPNTVGLKNFSPKYIFMIGEFGNFMCFLNKNATNDPSKSFDTSLFFRSEKFNEDAVISQMKQNQVSTSQPVAPTVFSVPNKAPAKKFMTVQSLYAGMYYKVKSNEPEQNYSLKQVQPLYPIRGITFLSNPWNSATDRAIEDAYLKDN